MRKGGNRRGRKDRRGEERGVQRKKKMSLRKENKKYFNPFLKV